MRTTLYILAALIVIAVGTASWTEYEANKGFTPWMTGAELNKFCAGFDTTPPGGHPNFWDKGHWIDAVEGRWHEGVPQYRLKYSDSPHGSGRYLWWYRYYNMDQQSYSRLVHELADQGFTLLDPNSFLRPDDSRRYQGVWHKVQTKLEHDAEKAQTDAQKQAAAPIPSPPASAPVTVVDHGLSLNSTAVDRAQLGHRCSVFVRPENSDLLQSTDNLPDGMVIHRGDFTIVTGTLYSISENMLLIKNQQRIYPVLDRQVDHVIFEQ
jgi:hypothetical protein